MEMAQFIGFYLLECNRFQNGKGSSKNNPVGGLHNTNGVTPLQFDRILLNKEVQLGVWRPQLLFQYSTLSHI